MAASVNEGDLWLSRLRSPRFPRGFEEVLELVLGKEAEAPSGGGRFRRN